MIRILVLIGQDKYLEPLYQFFGKNNYPSTIINTGSGAGNILPVVTNILKTDSYNLVISDCQLDHYSVTEFISSFKGIPLVVMAEKEESAFLKAAMEGGADNFFIKDPELHFLELLPVVINHTLQFAPEKKRFRRRTVTYHEYQYILNALPDIVYKIDSDGYFTYINHAADILGYEPGELTGKHFKVIIHPADYAKASREEILNRADTPCRTDTEQADRFKGKRRHRMGKEMFEIRLIPKNWNQGQCPVLFGIVIRLPGDNNQGRSNKETFDPLFLGSVGIIRNITHQKKSRDFIRKLYKIMHQSPVAILVTDSIGKIEYVNPCFLRTTGLKYKQIVHKSVDVLEIAEIKSSGYYTSLSEIIRDAQAWQGEILSVKANGDFFWESVFITPIDNLEGEPANNLIIKIDINELKAAQEVLQAINDELDKRVKERTLELEKANRELQRKMEKQKRMEKEQRKLEAQLFQSQKMETIGTLAGGIAHDFNNLLTPVLGFANLALIEIGEQGAGFTEIREIIQAARYAKDLVRQILTFSSAVEPERVPLDIAETINETVKMIKATLPSTIEIRIQNKAEGEFILANPAQLHQVLMNLCANAAYSMQDNYGLLEIRLSCLVVEGAVVLETIKLEKGKYIRLDVCDSGTGIKEDIINRIFDPFFTTKNKHHGTGLGLSVVHGIVTSHGGKIAVASKPGTGTRFSLYFPAYEGKREIPVEPERDFEKGTEHILLIDDEEKVGITIEKMLKALGYKITRNTAGSEALEEFASHPEDFDLVITDYAMPHLTGLELTKELHKIQEGMPVLLTTGYGDNIRKDDNIPAGINTILIKPFTLKELSTAVRQVLKERKTFKG